MTAGLFNSINKFTSIAPYFDATIHKWFLFGNFSNNRPKYADVMILSVVMTNQAVRCNF